MSGTYLYLLSPEVIEKTNAQLEKMARSEQAFRDYMGLQWGASSRALDRYPYEQFVLDWSRKAPGEGVYSLAHGLVNNRDIESVFMEAELFLLFLDAEWLPDPEWDEGVEDELLERLFDVRSFRAPSGGQETFTRRMSRYAFPEPFVRDAWLLNKLCWRRDMEIDEEDGEGDCGYPVWIIAGWDNYEGHLCGKELRQLSTTDDGFLKVFRRAIEVGEGPDREQTRNRR